MAGRTSLRAFALALLAAVVTVSPGSAGIADPPETTREVVGGQAGLICVWALYATMLEVGKKCGVPRDPRFETEVERSVSRMEDYARRQSPEGAVAMADYRVHQISGNGELCAADALTMYRRMDRTAPEALPGWTDRLLATSPPVEWGTCL